MMELIEEKKSDLKQKLDDINALLMELNDIEKNCQEILTTLTK
jgi:hypothetical protein